jgi:cytosine/creatinine deaminase
MNTLTPTPFYQRLAADVEKLGGMFNAHLHLDRAGTLDDKYFAGIGYHVLENSYVSLHRKHSMISDVHQGPAYKPKDLHHRVNTYLDMMTAVGTVRADTLVDVTADGVGLSALQVLLKIKRARAKEIDLRLGAYSPLGFTDAEPERWEILCAGAEQADFIGSLPEADDTREYPGNIGFLEHCRRVLDVSQRLNKMVHVHVDQRNEPSESGTEQLIEAVRRFGAPKSPSGEPMVWAIHAISPSTYEEDRFKRVVDGLLECNIGVISCPSAALGMRQYRPLLTPTYNSIPRILEMVVAGVHVRLGSDNIADICSPSTTANLLDEIFILSAALRFYHPAILARLAAGMPLSEDEKNFVKEHLRRNQLEVEKFLRHSKNSRLTAVGFAAAL